KQPVQAAPTWPPLPNGLATQPPPGRIFADPAPVTDGTAALLAEAAVLEAAGITEAAEIDEDAVQALLPSPDEASEELLASWPPPAPGTVLDLTAPTELGALPDPRPGGESVWAAALLDDVSPRASLPVVLEPPAPAPAAELDAVILAEEAALEADRLEAERLELARLEAARTRTDDQAQREAERDEALTRFDAQRREAQELLSLQADREAAAHQEVAEERRPMMAGDLAGSRRATDIDPSPGAFNPEPAITAPPEVEAEASSGDPLWPAEEAGPERPVPPAATDEDVLIPQSLEPLVPDEVVADLEDEPMWGTALGDDDDDGAPPEIVRLDELDDELELEPLRTAEDDSDEAFEDDLRLESLPAADADAEADEDELEPSELDVAEEAITGQPLLAGEHDEGLLPVPAWPDEDDDDLDDLDEAMAAEPAPPATAAPDPLVLEDEPEEAAEWDAEDEEEVLAWGPVDASTDRRRPLMTADFDDVLPEEMFEDEDDAGETSAADDRLVQQSRRRTPLKARRAGNDTGASEPAAPTRRPVAKKAAKKAPGPAKAAKSAKPAAVKRVVTTAKSAPRVTKAEPARSPARPSPALAKTTKKLTKAAPPAPVLAKVTAPAKVSAPAKKVSTRRRRPDVLWVEPVGGACPTGYPVKASLSSGIFHVVGGLFYERSTPDRCYRTPSAAEGDGLRQAKR
ncbi:MAG TPA: hypothetical protein VGP53_03135, partial [Acidimicrobiales bacterium]|nr:hypothetical protein [Acidimicrobiales bacterium]